MTDVWLPSRVGRGGKTWEFGINRCKVLYIGWVNSKVLLYSSGNYIQYPGNIIIEKNIKKNVDINTTL